MRPLLTILLPIARIDKYLSIAIQSIKDQTFENYICYILTSPLTDVEYENLKLLISDDKKFSIHVLSLGGIAFALNYGLNISKTKYIARMDADDISLPNRFRRQVEFMEENPSYALVGCRVELIDYLGNPIKHNFQFFETDEEIRHALKYRMPLCHPALMFRTDVLVLMKGYLYDNSSEDHELFIRIARDKKQLFKNLPQTLFSYRRHDLQLTNKKNAKIAYCNISGFLMTEFLISKNPYYIIGIFANHPFFREFRAKLREILRIL